MTKVFSFDLVRLWWTAQYMTYLNEKLYTTRGRDIARVLGLRGGIIDIQEGSYIISCNNWYLLCECDVTLTRFCLSTKNFIRD